jgi:hypothetical protein
MSVSGYFSAEFLKKFGASYGARQNSKRLSTLI